MKESEEAAERAGTGEGMEVAVVGSSWQAVEEENAKNAAFLEEKGNEEVTPGDNAEVRKETDEQRQEQQVTEYNKIHKQNQEWAKQLDVGKEQKVQEKTQECKVEQPWNQNKKDDQEEQVQGVKGLKLVLEEERKEERGPVVLVGEEEFSVVLGEEKEGKLMEEVKGESMAESELDSDYSSMRDKSELLTEDMSKQTSDKCLESEQTRDKCLGNDIVGKEVERKTAPLKDWTSNSETVSTVDMPCIYSKEHIQSYSEFKEKEKPFEKKGIKSVALAVGVYKKAGVKHSFTKPENKQTYVVGKNEIKISDKIVNPSLISNFLPREGIVIKRTGAKETSRWQEANKSVSRKQKVVKAIAEIQGAKKTQSDKEEEGTRHKDNWLKLKLSLWKDDQMAAISNPDPRPSLLQSSMGR